MIAYSEVNDKENSYRNKYILRKGIIKFIIIIVKNSFNLNWNLQLIVRLKLTINFLNLR